MYASASKMCRIQANYAYQSSNINKNKIIKFWRTLFHSETQSQSQNSSKESHCVLWANRNHIFGLSFQTHGMTLYGQMKITHLDLAFRLLLDLVFQTYDPTLCGQMEIIRLDLVFRSVTWRSVGKMGLVFSFITCRFVNECKSHFRTWFSVSPYYVLWVNVDHTFRLGFKPHHTTFCGQMRSHF